MSLAGRLLAGRDRLLTSPGFRRWAAGFPLTRRIAGARARELFDLSAGFVYSQILLAATRLGLFDLLAEGPASAETLAERVGLTPDAMRRLLEAATAIRLFERRTGGTFGLGRLGAPLVQNPGVTAMIEHNALLYQDLCDPVALLRRETAGEDCARLATALSRHWPYAESDAPADVSAESVAEYSALMSASVTLVAEEVLDAWPVERHRILLDVGGGEGGFVARAAVRSPALRCILFDLPAVASRARRRLDAAGLGDRVRTVGGSFLSDPLPEGADLISLVRVLHDHDDAAVATILSACRRAMVPSGRLLIAEPMARIPGSGSVGAAYFGMYLLAMGSGRARTVEEYARLLVAAGYSRVTPVRTRTPVQAGLIAASL